MLVPRVSVVLPVYNGAGSVSRAVESIRQQTFGDWELLVCDDGSEDGSLRICEQLARGDSRVRVFRNERNRGLAASMNRLVSAASGEFVAVQEQDDESVPERLVWEVEELDRHPDVGVVSGIAAWLDDEGRVFDHFPGMLKAGRAYPEPRDELVRFLYVEQCKVVNAAAMIRRSLFSQMSLAYDETARMSIDWQFFVDAAHRTRIHGIPRVLVRMTRGRRRRSLTSNKSLQFREARRCIRILYERYRSDPASPVNRRLYRQAMATQLVLEARQSGGLRGLPLLLAALANAPWHPWAWRTAQELAQRVGRRLVRVGGWAAA